MALTPAKIKFLITLASAIKNGAVKTIKQAIGFAKREFDEIDTEFTNRIINVFKKEGKTKKGEVVPIKKDEGIMATDEAADIVNKRTDDIKRGDPEGEGVESLDTSMKKIKKLTDELKKNQITPESIFDTMIKSQRVMAEGYKTGNIRTAVREFMRSEVKAGRLKLNETDSFRIREYSPMNEDDPIDVFRRHYGEDALEAVDEIGDVFMQGESFKHYEELLRNSVDKKFLTVKKVGAGEYDASVVAGEKIRKAMEQEAKQKKILEDFKIDPDREPNAYGGIAGNLHLNRTGYFAGRLVKGYEVGKKILELLKDKKKLKEAYDNIFPTGDYKYDADMVAESLVENNQKVFGNRLYEDLTDAERSAVYGAGLEEASTNFAKALKFKRSMKSMEETGTINISDDAVAEEFATFMKETDPEGHAKIQKVVDDANQQLELKRFKTKGRKKNADGGLINILKL